MDGINVNKLRGRIVEKGFSVASLAAKLGMDKATLYRKLGSGGKSMTVQDANRIVEALGLSADEATSIFFSQVVA